MAWSRVLWADNRGRQRILKPVPKSAVKRRTRCRLAGFYLIEIDGSQLWPPARDQSRGAHDRPFSVRQPDAGAAGGDKCYFSCELAHGMPVMTATFPCNLP